MSLTLKIASRVSDDFGNPISSLMHYISELNSKPEETEIILDFSEVKFTSPFILGGLSAEVAKLKAEGKSVSVLTNGTVESYLETVYFPDGFSTTEANVENIEAKLLSYHRKNFIPIVAFPATNRNAENKVREKMLSAVNSIFKTQLKLTGDVLEAVYYLVAELTQNVADHSGIDRGLIVAQFYPTKNYMDVCIADCGKGLRQSYVDSGSFSPDNDEEAIKLALNGKSTKPEAGSRGFGIPTSRKMLTKGLKGKFFMWTGNAFIYQNIEKEEIISVPEQFYRRGCLVALRIPIFANTQFKFYNYLE